MISELEPEVLDRRYTAYGGAAEYMAATELEVLCESGAGTGKTFSLMRKADWTARQYPGSRQFFARDTRVSLTESVLLDFEAQVLWPGHPAMTGTATPGHRERYTYPNGSHIVLFGLEDVDHHMSTQFDRGYIFEATETSLEAWEKLLSRMRHGRTPYHQLTADVNPGSEFAWLNQRFPQAGEPNPKDGKRRIFYRHEDNPLWYDNETGEWTEAGIEYRERVLGSLTGARKERLLFHRWVSEEGQILPTYDPEHNCISRDAVPEIKWYGCSLDFGWRNPGCFQVWGVDADDRCYRVAEIYRVEKHLDWWAEKICALHKEFPFVRGVADSAEPRTIEFLNDRLSDASGRNLPRIIQPADKSKGKLHGFDQLRWALDRDESGKPRMMFVKDALREGADPLLRKALKPVCTEQEIPAFVWLKAEDGKALKELPDPGCAEHGISAATYWSVFHWRRDMSDPPPVPEYAPWTFGDVLGYGKEPL